MNIDGSYTFFSALEQYQLTYEKALQIMNVFHDVEIEELKGLKAELDIEINKFLNISGLDVSNFGNLTRHLNFMDFYFEKNNKSNAVGDINDIVFHDLPAGLRQLIAKQSINSHFDQSLKDGVLPLIQGKHYDSAIRKAFVLLTERLRRVFNIEGELDGDTLINQIFGGNSNSHLNIDESKKQSYRNLISGFYGVYRNKFAHNDVEPTLAEVKSILEMINNIILEIEELSHTSINLEQNQN